MSEHTSDEVRYDQFSALLSMLAAAFGVEMSEARFEAYWLGLVGISIQDLKTAIARAIRSERFMPTPVVLRELAGEQSASHLAVRAWTAVRLAIRAHGAYATVDFDDHAINATVRVLGGWVRLCSTESEELDRFVRRDFTRIYEGYTGFGVPSVDGAPLEGIHALNASSSGYLPPPIVRVVTGLPPTREFSVGASIEDPGLPSAIGPAGLAELVEGGGTWRHQ